MYTTSRYNPSHPSNNFKKSHLQACSHPLCWSLFFYLLEWQRQTELHCFCFPRSCKDQCWAMSNLGTGNSVRVSRVVEGLNDLGIYLLSQGTPPPSPFLGGAFHFALYLVTEKILWNLYYWVLFEWNFNWIKEFGGWGRNSSLSHHCCIPAPMVRFLFRCVKCSLHASPTTY